MQGYNFTERVRKVLAMAREEAARLHHEYVGTEHILLGLIREGEGVAAAVLQNLSVDLGQLRQQTEAAVRKGKADPTVGPDLPYTSRAKKVLELAMREARDLDHSYVGTEHLLLGLLDEEQGIAARSLREAGVTTERARAETLRLLGTQPPPASIPGTVEVDITIRTPGGAPSRHTFPSGRDALNFLALRFPDARPWTPAREENAHGQVTISDGHVTLHHGRTEPVPGGRRMGIIPAGAHRALDFVTVVAFAVAPTLFGMTGRTVMLAYALAAVHLILTLATHVPGREPRPVPYHVHGLIELLVGAALVALPLLRGWTGGARTFYLGIGVVILLVWLLTSYRDVVSAPRPPAARTPAV